MRVYTTLCEATKDNKGFTFLELLIVALILGLIAAMGFSSLTASVDRAQLSGATSEIMTAIRYAQLTAMSSGRACQVKVDDVEDEVSLKWWVYVKWADIIDPGITTFKRNKLNGNSSSERELGAVCRRARSRS